MNCLFCGASLSEEALFCSKCGKLATRGMSESSESECDTPTAVSVFSPSDPYSTRSSISYRLPSPEGGTQTYAPLTPPPPPGPYVPLAPPSPRYHFSPRFIKSLFSGIFVILLLSVGLGGWLLLRHETHSPLTPHIISSTPTLQSIVQNGKPAATTPVSPTLTPQPTPTLQSIVQNGRLMVTTPVPPTPTPQPTLNLSTEAPLSNDTVQAWRSTSHAYSIETRWTQSNGQWTAWITGAYPPSKAGVIGMSADTQQSITYFTV
ncbi:MAG TPA: zinc ribbon domain-containing protein [Ktedonobacteraceae bacterium]|nr:zinc ribbon domain-containing protein [Ktedonobacteraceae bacterium]